MIIPNHQEFQSLIHCIIALVFLICLIVYIRQYNKIGEYVSAVSVVKTGFVASTILCVYVAMYYFTFWS